MANAQPRPQSAREVDRQRGTQQAKQDSLTTPGLVPIGIAHLDRTERDEVQWKAPLERDGRRPKSGGRLSNWDELKIQLAIDHEAVAEHQAALQALERENRTRLVQTSAQLHQALAPTMACVRPAQTAKAKAKAKAKPPGSPRATEKGFATALGRAPPREASGARSPRQCVSNSLASARSSAAAKKEMEAEELMDSMQFRDHLLDQRHLADTWIFTTCPLYTNPDHVVARDPTHWELMRDAGAIHRSLRTRVARTFAEKDARGDSVGCFGDWQMRQDFLRIDSAENPHHRRFAGAGRGTVLPTQPDEAADDEEVIKKGFKEFFRSSTLKGKKEELARAEQASRRTTLKQRTCGANFLHSTVLMRSASKARGRLAGRAG
eukprot:gb/GFBE01010260.1/.p1 GENE.gb/GFBE01010260.1/~~gb/GFBE01010260.1/.p1  ORF type:complete len:378 (+),score=64.09 gb/GFBE01010260.1/:1-1134(+)